MVGTAGTVGTGFEAVLDAAGMVAVDTSSGFAAGDEQVGTPAPPAVVAEEYADHQCVLLAVGPVWIFRQRKPR